MRARFVLVLTLFAGCKCGGSSNNAAPAEAAAPVVSAESEVDAAQLNACVLLTQAELEKTTGLLSPPKRGHSRTNATCTWGTFEKKMVVVEVFPNASHFDESRRSFETLYKGHAEDVPGIGKRAFYLEGVASIAAATLVAEKPTGGAVLVQVSGKDFSLTKAKDEVTAIAKIVVAK